MNKIAFHFAIIGLLISTQSKASIFFKPAQDTLLFDKQELIETSISFHKWFLGNIQDYKNMGVNGFYVIEDTNHYCKLESKKYFDEVRQLGTVSEQFLESELDRVKTCSDFLSKIKYADYRKADAYEYSDSCGFMDYFYWIGSQEPMTSVEASEMTLWNDYKSAKVIIRLYDNYGDQKQYRNDYKVFLRIEESRWKIYKMERIFK